MARRGMSKYIDKRVPSTFKIQITSMVDMFVILLVFLLKSYSTSPVQISASKDLTLPVSTSLKDPVDVLQLMVSKGGIFVENKKVVALNDGKLDTKEVSATDTQFIQNLYNELDTRAKSSKQIAKSNDTVEFDGKVILQADRALPYDLLRKVMYTSMMAGYSDVKIAVMTRD